MKSCLVSFFVVVCLLACGDAPRENAPTPETPNPGGKRYLALGDSYTIGQSVSTSERWPVILARDLSYQGIKVVDLDIIAVTGWTTSDLLAAVNNDAVEKNYDMVSLQIGVNNQYRGQSIERFRTEFKQLLSKSVEFADGEIKNVFVLSIPDWSVSKYGSAYDRNEIGKEIDAFNMVAEKECNSAGILFIDITNVSRLALNDPSMLASDGLHFSGQMHQLWVDAIVPKLKTR